MFKYNSFHKNTVGQSPNGGSCEEYPAETELSWILWTGATIDLETHHFGANMDAWLPHLLSCSFTIDSCSVIALPAFALKTPFWSIRETLAQQHGFYCTSFCFISYPLLQKIFNKDKNMSKDYIDHCLWGVQSVPVVNLNSHFRSWAGQTICTTCRYVFVWAVCLTSIEMDLTFVLVVKFISVTRFITYYMYRPPNIALWVQEAWEGGKFLNDECAG